MKKHILYLIGLLIVAFYIIFGTVFEGDHIPMIILTLTSLFFVTILNLRKKEEVSILDCFKIAVPFFMLLFISGIFVKDFSRIIQYLLFTPISSVLAYLYLKTKKIVIIPLSLSFFYCVGRFMFITMFSFISNINAEKNIVFPEVTLLNDFNKPVLLDKNKVIVLDFWSTSCGICFTKFPDLEATSDKYKNNKNVEIYAVNFPIRGDKFNKTIKILDSIGYKFPKLFAKSAKQIEDSLHFNTFPHLIIVKNGKIRYEGMFETQKNTFVFSIESEIEKLLNE